MPGLGDNILGLSKLRQKGEEAIANLAEPLRLTLVAPVGTNPGNLRMLTYVPPGLPDHAPLVVALHGCTQNAAAYDHGAGWSTLAERHGFALLLPEQQRANNPNLCFNWFQPEDVTRGQGEVESIREMVEQVVAVNRIDPRRVFITGLSAGGGMTSAMLATAPELFAGGAIIAGLPYAAASSVMEALTAMGQVRRHSAKEWGDLVRAASPDAGSRPAVQIWQGTADSTVNPGNADELVSQWSDVLGLPAKPTTTEQVDGVRHDTWSGKDGSPMLERWTVSGLGHGTPILSGGTDADQAVGIPGPYMLASRVSSTWQLARRWGLLTQAARAVEAPQKARALAPGIPVLGAVPAVGTVIEKALRAARLLK